MPPPSRPVKCAFQLQQLMDNPSQLVPLFLSPSASFKDPLMIGIMKDLWCEWHQGSQELILCFYSPPSLHNLRTWRRTRVKTGWDPVRAAHNRKTPRCRLLTWHARWNAVLVIYVSHVHPGNRLDRYSVLQTQNKTNHRLFLFFYPPPVSLVIFWLVWNKW